MRPVGSGGGFGKNPKEAERLSQDGELETKNGKNSYAPVRLSKKYNKKELIRNSLPVQSVRDVLKQHASASTAVGIGGGDVDLFNIESSMAKIGAKPFTASSNFTVGTKGIRATSIAKMQDYNEDIKIVQEAVQNSIHSQNQSPRIGNKEGSILKQEVLSKMWSGGDIPANGMEINGLKNRNMQVNVNFVG